MKKSILLLLQLYAVGVMAATPAVPRSSKPAYKDPSRPIPERVTDLLGRMTLQEKVMQLNQYLIGRDNNANNVGEAVKVVPPEIGSLIYFSRSPEMRNAMQRQAMEHSRLGIPILFGYDVIHGYKTILPVPLAMACSWNTGLIEKASHVAAAEAKLTGIDWGFSPMVDIARDARWGRVVEGFGEDPYAVGTMASAVVHGFQGKSLGDSLSIAACMKHFVGYGASEAGLDYVFTDMSRQTLWDTYLVPYQMGIANGAATVMCGFNDLAGIPASANHYTMTDVLRGQFGFKGFVVSDWGSIGQLRVQGYAKEKRECAEKAFLAGLDMDMMGHCYDKYLAALVDTGAVKLQQLDESVVRVLSLKFELGLFDHPYTPVIADAKRNLLPAYKATACALAAQSMVLLKNERSILPLASGSRIAVIGPTAADAHNLLGSWFARGEDKDVESLLDGLKRNFGARRVLYAKGCDYEGTDTMGFAAARAAASRADVVLLCIGEKGNWSGENASRSSLALPKVQLDLVSAIARCGKPVVVIVSNGRPVELREIEPSVQAILDIWHPGTMGAQALCDILSGKENPSGRLAITFPYSTGQIPIYYNRRPSRQGSGKYHDITSDPMYRFGDGLSYTTYSYGELKAPKVKIRRGETIKLSIDVTNSGDRDGMETVFWYVRDPYCSVVTRPVKELRHFEKRLVKKSQTETFTFSLSPERDLAYVDDGGRQVLENGTYYIMVKDKKIEIELID